MREEIKVQATLTFDCDADHHPQQQVGDIEAALNAAAEYLSEVKQGIYLVGVEVTDFSPEAQTYSDVWVETNRTLWVLITVEDGDIETSYYGKDMQAETTAYKILMAGWPDDEPKPDNFEEAYEVSRCWSSIDMRIEQCPSS